MAYLNEAPILPTTLARSGDTVNLDTPWPKVIAWGVVGGFALFAARHLFMRGDGSQRADAITELAREARRIQRRNTRRRAMKV